MATEEAMNLVKEQQVFRFVQGAGTSEVTDTVVTEYALTIFVNDEEMATVVCSPEHMEDLVTGFLASEGVIRSVDQIEDLYVNSLRGMARVKTSGKVNFNQDFYNKRYIASCCGKSRQTFYFYNDAHTAKKITDSFQIQPDDVFWAMNAMEDSSDVFHHTGGVHTASLADQGEIILSRSDIGRHNALDKIYGYALKHRLDLSGKFIIFSGRLSSEVLLKVSKIGVGMVLAKSAPTKLALDIADELNITTVGFIRGESFNVYTHPERIIM